MAKGTATTIVDVARQAGVSRQTVTRALNGMKDISPATRERVLLAAQTLHYRPNRAAQGLVRGRDVTLGLLVEDLRNPYYPALASELSRQAAALEWGLILCDVGKVDDGVPQRLAPLLRRVDVLIGRIPRAVDSLRIPTVLLDGHPDDAVDAVVVIDHRTGIRGALHHLTEALGCRHIAMIDQGPEPTERCLAYREYLADHDLAWTPLSEVRVDDSHDVGVRAATELLTQYSEVDAVLVFNDVLAIGALKGFAHSGTAVPDEIAVIGMDGLDIGALVTPELTSIAIDRSELAQHAIALAADLLEGRVPAGERPAPILTPHLLIRDSA